jgi:hypothetical protein
MLYPFNLLSRLLTAAVVLSPFVSLAVVTESDYRKAVGNSVIASDGSELEVLTAPFCKSFPPMGTTIRADIASHDFCVLNSNSTQHTGLIVRRGGCTFETKIRNAESQGYSVILIINNQNESALLPMLTDRIYSTIYAAMMSWEDSVMLLSQRSADNVGDFVEIMFPVPDYFMVCLSRTTIIAYEAAIHQRLERQISLACIISAASLNDMAVNKSLFSNHVLCSKIPYVTIALNSYLQGLTKYRERGLLQEVGIMTESLYIRLLNFAARGLFAVATESISVKETSAQDVSLAVKERGLMAIFNSMLYLSDGAIGLSDGRVFDLATAFTLPKSEIVRMLLRNERVRLPIQSRLCILALVIRFAYVGSETPRIYSDFESGTCMLPAASSDYLKVELDALVLAKDSSLWLAHDELKYLASKFGARIVVDYVAWLYSLRSLQTTPSHLLLQGCDKLALADNDPLFAVLQHFASDTERMMYLRAISASHARLGIYWDEMGCWGCSVQHMRASTLTQLLIRCHYSVEASNATVSTVGPCLILREVFTDPVIFDSITEVMWHRDQQVIACNSLMSLPAARTNGSDQQQVAFDRWTSALRLYINSQTMASMMIGYDGVSSFDVNKILQQSHQWHGRCFRGQPSNATSSFTTILGRNGTDENSKHSGRKRIKLGFVGGFFFEHSVGRLLNHVISSLDKTDFHVHVFAIHAFRPGRLYEDADSTVSALHRIVESWISLPVGQKSNSSQHSGPQRQVMEAVYTVKDIVELLSTFLLDIVIFPELGMDVFTAAVAQASRYAPIQVLFWGHPIDQHIMNPVDDQLSIIDYFISSDVFEIELARRGRLSSASRRAEQVVLFDSLSTYFTRPTLDAARKLKLSGVALPQSVQMALQSRGMWSPNQLLPTIIFLPHTLMKYSIDFTSALATLMLRESEAIVVLIYNEAQRHWKTRLLNRMWRQFSEMSSSPLNVSNCMSRIVAVPRLSKDEYSAFLSQHVTLVLDTFPFGK